jgi:hypothetical protein
MATGIGCMTEDRHVRPHNPIGFSIFADATEV